MIVKDKSVGHWTVNNVEWWNYPLGLPTGGGVEERI